MFQKVLIANRGEIAVRIIQACRDLGIISVAVYSEADREALHAQIADEAVCIGPARAADSYLNMDNIISAALASGCQAIHPGFGFLSENPDFAERITQAGLAFIGPTAATIRLMGDKSEAKRNAIAAGVPVALGTDGPLRDFDEAISEAERIGYPVMLKAASGGGGKGIRVAESVKDLKDAYDSASAEAIANFGDGRLYMEKYIHNPRHIEVQILGDNYGNVVHLFERECSVQRRHQKLIHRAAGDHPLHGAAVGGHRYGKGPGDGQLQVVVVGTGKTNLIVFRNGNALAVQNLMGVGFGGVGEDNFSVVDDVHRADHAGDPKGRQGKQNCEESQREGPAAQKGQQRG